MNISHLDHLVLTVKDINISADFYQKVLGMALNLNPQHKPYISGVLTYFLLSTLI